MNAPPSAVLSALPAPFLARLQQILADEDREAVVRSFSEPKRVGLRINRLSADVDRVQQELSELGFPIAWGDDWPGTGTVAAEYRERLSRCAPSERGAIYLQNLSSIWPVRVLDPQPGHEVLDLAAAPGGKTLLIAERLAGQGRLAAVEVIRERFYRLQANLKRHGAEQTRLYLTDGRTVGRKTGPRFDRILLDAPCSSEARFHTSRPESWSRWSERKVREQARKQVGLLASAVQGVKVGGVVVYSTCSFAPEENELVVQKVLDRYGPAVRIEPIVEPVPNARPALVRWQGHPLNDELSGCIRMLPDSSYDAFFLCRLKKLEPLESTPRFKSRTG